MFLSERWIHVLVNLPETGMGYQVVDVHLENNRVIKSVTVLNYKELLIPLELTVSENDIKDITVLDNF